MSVSYIQKIKANRIMNYGDLEFSHLLTMNFKRVMKYITRQKDGIHKGTTMASSFFKKTL